MGANHITVCICTFKRPQLLTVLLNRLDKQSTDELFTYSVVVVDNDKYRSGHSAVTAFSTASRLSVTYCVEPRQNIALARNTAVQHADGDLIAFIDDDEFPESEWLCTLFKARVKYSVAGVLGPVKPYFEHDPPSWATTGQFFERPRHVTGYKLTWSETRSGNVLFRKDILCGVDFPFKAEFDTAGEDVDFFRRMMEKGHVFIWCDEAIVHEVVPPSRCTRTYLLKRAMLRGSNFPKQRKNRIRNAVKSMIAVPCYTLALPFLAIFGQHLFLKYLIKLLDHASRLLAFLGLPLITQRAE